MLREPEQLAGGGALYLNHHCEFRWGVCGGTMDTVAPVPNQQHERTNEGTSCFYQAGLALLALFTSLDEEQVGCFVEAAKLCTYHYPWTGEIYLEGVSFCLIELIWQVCH